jgi:hypothetical protein
MLPPLAAVLVPLAVLLVLLVPLAWFWCSLAGVVVTETI